MRIWWIGMALVAACVGSVDPARDDDTADTEVARGPGEVVPDPLASGDFAFCDEGVAEPGQAQRWCALLAEIPPDRCPGLRRACDQDDFAAPAGCLSPLGGLGGAGGKGSAGAPPAPTRPAWQPDLGCDGPEGCDAPDTSAPGGFPGLRWVTALGVAGLVVLLLRAILLVLGRRGGVDPVVRPTAVHLDVSPVEGDDDLPLLPEEALLAHARSAIEEGRLGEAVIYARGAALRRLARQGRLRLHRARTDREYLRGLGDDAERVRALRSVLDAVEAHRWAQRRLTPALAQEALHGATRLLGLCALLALLPAAAHGGDRYGLQGDAGIYRLLDEAGYDVAFHAGPLADLPNDVDVVVLDQAGVTLSDADADALTAFVLDGGVLVEGGDAPRPGLSGWTIRQVDAGLGPAATGRWDRMELPLPRWPGDSAAVLCAGDELSDSVVLVRAAGGLDRASLVDRGCTKPALVVITQVGQGHVLQVADSTLLWNGALMVDANREVLVRLLPSLRTAGLTPGTPAHPRVALALVAQAQSDSPVDQVGQARMLPLLLQLFALWLVVAAWRGLPFSPRRDAPAAGRLAFVDHARALGRQWARVGDSTHAAGAVARLWLGRLGPRGLHGAALRHGLDPATASLLVARAEWLADPSRAPEPDEPFDPDTFVEALWRLTRHP